MDFLGNSTAYGGEDVLIISWQSGLLLDLYKEYGTDSRIGLIASISMACTETIFYTMSVYFMTAKVRKSRYTLPGALIATFAWELQPVWCLPGCFRRNEEEKFADRVVILSGRMGCTNRLKRVQSAV